MVECYARLALDFHHSTLPSYVCFFLNGLLIIQLWLVTFLLLFHFSKKESCYVLFSTYMSLNYEYS